MARSMLHSITIGTERAAEDQMMSEREGSMENCDINDTNASLELPLDECVENACASRRHWKRSVKRGCLSKGLMDKARLYSRVRQLTTQSHLPLESILCLKEEEQQQTPQPQQQQQGQEKEKGKEEGGIAPSSVVIADGDDDRLTSVVIVEDTSTPPQPSEEATPRYFTDDGLISFLSSNEWGGPKMIRLVSGNMLSRVLAALYMLETRRMIFTRTARAYLNNGSWKLPQEVTMDHTVDDESPPPPLEKEWISEKILVDMVYYGKLNRSSKASTREPHVERHCKPQTPFAYRSEIAKLAVRSPVAHRLYPIEKLKLPPGENYDLHFKIHKLKCERVNMETEAHINSQKHDREGAAGGKYKEPKTSLEHKDKGGKGTEIPVIEDITEDLCFVDGYSEEKAGEKEEEKEEEEKEKGGELEEEDHNDDAEDAVEDNVDIIESENLADKHDDLIIRRGSRLSIRGRAHSQGSLGEEVLKHDKYEEEVKEQSNVESLTDTHRSESMESKATEDHVTASSFDPSETSLKWPDDGVKDHLNLSGNELYPSSLYKEREKNAQPIAFRLHQANKERLKQSRETANDVYKKFYQSRNVDLNTRFKRLAATRELERIKATAPSVPKTNKELDRAPKKIDTLEDTWDRYYKDQEEMEMRVATDNNQERRILKRLTEARLEPSTPDPNQAKKNKVEKQKSKNNNSSTGNITNNAMRKRLKIVGRHRSKPMSILKPVTERNTVQKQTLNRDKRTPCSDNKTANDEKTCFDSLHPVHTFKPKSVHFSSRATTASGLEDASTLVSYLKNDKSLNERLKILDTKYLMRDTSTSVKNKPKTKLPPLIKRKSGMDTSPTRVGQTSRENFQTRLGNHVTGRKPRRMRRKSVSNEDGQNRVSKRTSAARDQSTNSVHTLDGHSGSKTESVRSTSDASVSVKDRSDEAEDQPVSTAPPTPIGPSESETLRLDLARFDAACHCYECVKDDFEDLRPDCRERPFTHPNKLGCIKKPARYLRESKKAVACPASTGACEAARRHLGIVDERLRREVLGLLDKMVIRKEILTSSLGKTFTTILFIK